MSFNVSLVLQLCLGGTKENAETSSQKGVLRRSIWIWSFHNM